jgi:IMP dehydrogenase/GMP reductase
MATLLNTRSIGYNDVVLIAQPGVVKSRKQVPIEGKRLVVSAMTSIVGPDFIKAVAKLPYDLRPTIHIPRDIYAKENLTLAKELGLSQIFVGVGLETPELEELAKKLNYRTVLLDVANGYAPNVKEKVTKLRKDGFNVIAGSVHTYKGAIDLIHAGAHTIRSGIGTGSPCITKSETGFTRAQITEIFDLSHIKTFSTQYQVLADGGHKCPGDLVKAFLAGADYCMSGRLFVDCAESRLRVDGSDIYFGQASKLGKESMGKEIKNIEGIHCKLSRENVRPLEQILTEYWGAIRSGISYSGYSTLSEAIGNGTFELIS